MKKLAVFLALGVISLSATGQTDQIINSSINAFVQQNDNSFLGFIVAPQDGANDVDVVILAEGGSISNGSREFDPVVRVYFDSTDGSPVAVNDDWGGSGFTQEYDFPDNNVTANARNCWANQFANRLGEFDSMVLLSITAPGGTRAVFAEVREYEGAAGDVNLQLLQVDGPLSGTCPDF